jgi:hypothetical protein
MIACGIVTMTACQAYQPTVPSVAPSTAPIYKPGQCILGTNPDCMSVIPTQPAPTPPPVVHSLSIRVECASQDDGSVECRVSGTRDGKEWTSHLVKADWSWSDGTEQFGYLTIHHVFPHQGSWSFGVTAYDDSGLNVYSSGSVTSKIKE